MRIFLIFNVTQLIFGLFQLSSGIFFSPFFLVCAPLALPCIINLSLPHPLSLISFSTYPPLLFLFCLFFSAVTSELLLLTLSSSIAFVSPSFLHLFYYILTFFPFCLFFFQLAFLPAETAPGPSLLGLSVSFFCLLTPHGQLMQMVAHAEPTAGCFLLLEGSHFFPLSQDRRVQRSEDSKS